MVTLREGRHLAHLVVVVFEVLNLVEEGGVETVELASELLVSSGPFSHVRCKGDFETSFCIFHNRLWIKHGQKEASEYLMQNSSQGAPEDIPAGEFAVWEK